ncbi:MAG: PduL/EutD family phosphate acyltransferase, partial [Bacillota bacterium]|nr:PduL/EutD family phosphate acyltransferase [Bacillota bacterium]
GSLAGSPGVVVTGPKGKVTLNEGVIVAWRHIHISAKQANELGLKDKELVRVKSQGDRAVVFENVLVRANDAFALEMHIDTDEANAAQIKNGDKVELIK